MNIGFSKSHKLLSKIIRKLTHSKVSHAYIKFEVAGEEAVLHATQHGVNSDYYETFKEHNTIVAEFTLHIPQSEQDKILAYVIQQLDKPYDFKSAMGFAWVLVNKIFGRKVKNPLSDGGAYYCSELILQALKAGHISGLEVFVRDASPEDLLEFFLVHPLIERTK